MIACEKGKQWDTVLRLLQSMLRSLTLDVVSWNAAASACEKGQQWEAALRLHGLLSGLGADVGVRRRPWEARERQ